MHLGGQHISERAPARKSQPLMWGVTDGQEQNLFKLRCQVMSFRGKTVVSKRSCASCGHWRGSILVYLHHHERPLLLNLCWRVKRTARTLLPKKEGEPCSFGDFKGIHHYHRSGPKVRQNDHFSVGEVLCMSSDKRRLANVPILLQSGLK